jgi:hypothetical protein
VRRRSSASVAGAGATLDALRREVQRVVARQKRGSPRDLSAHGDELDALLASISEIRPEWGASPCVHRVARIETERGVLPFEDLVVLPDVKHTYELMLEMLGHIRAQKGLRPVTMPLFLQPDEIALALHAPAPEGLEEELPPPAAEPAPSSRRRRQRRPRRPSWEKTRLAVLDRDDWRCRRCGATRDLHLHRVDEERDEHDPDAFITLCRACVLRIERRESASQAEWHGLRPEDASHIRSQLALVFQRAELQRVGCVFGRTYAVLEA